MRILLIDDEKVELFIAKKILSSEFQTEGFNYVSEALEWAKNNSFDILLSDYYLDKNLDAQKALQMLVDLKGKTFKAFVLTNYVDNNKIAELKAAGFEGVIEKPLTLDKFKKAAGI